VSSQDERWLLKEKYGGEKSRAFFADLERLRAGEPLAYLIGHVPFLGCRIYLDSRPLIPRPETEFWVEKAIEKIKTVAAPRVLDLGAGTGAIGVAVAKHCPDAGVTFAEIDPTHLPTIEKNLAQNLSIDGKVLSESKSKRFQVIQSDLFEKVEGQYDFILSNPPYIDPALDRAESSVKACEPHLALYGGQGGLDVILAIINDSKRFLAPHGQLWIEHEPEQVETIRQSAEAYGFRATTHPDQYGVSRFSVLMR
jgi:release factor glutamine methyltransferase